MRSETSYLHGYTDEYAPIFESTHTAFRVIFKNMNYNKTDTTVNETVHDAVHDTDHDENKDDKIRKLIDFCAVSRSRDEMQSFVGVTHRGHFRTAYLKPLLEKGQLKMTLPDKPSSHHQRYIKA
ncbi:MAG: hypothetical protein FWG70_10305 [Oscillospiraceae bacterium]|nr:hypothetical protein [Oscillospiraceae bacterium]